MRQQRTEAAAIEAEIAHLRSLALDALRRRWLKPGTVLVRDYQGERHTVTVVPDGFDWQGATYTSLSAIARAITGTAWSGPRFFALAPRNGTPARGNNKRSARGDRNGSQPARGSNKASLPLETVSPA